jgi:hypothetical protein
VYTESHEELLCASMAVHTINIKDATTF